MSTWLGLQHRVCVVTGSGGDIGAAIAEGFARVGAHVLLIDINRDNATAVANRIRNSGGSVHFSVCDVADRSDVERARDTCLRTFGRCDVLVNNAAILRAGNLACLALSDWNDIIAVNLSGYFLCAQTFGAEMRRQGGGAIVHVASISGTHPQPFSGAYSVSKAGILMLSRQLAVEWGTAGVRSNVVSPALIRTTLSEPIYRDEDVLAQRETAVPLARIGAVEDIADAVLFLASHRASYISGEEIVIGGGFQQNLLALIPRPGFDRAASEK